MEQGKRTNAVLPMLLIGLKLLLICAIVAGVVSFVFALTSEQYERNIQETKNAAIGEIFDLSAPRAELLSGETGETVYRVFDGERFIGYCVEVATPGFGGDIQMMVGYGDDGRILGVSIVSLSETPGVGTRVNDASFLSGFEGKENGNGVDTLASATVSSSAVIDGVNKASDTLQKILKGGAAA